MPKPLFRLTAASVLAAVALLGLHCPGVQGLRVCDASIMPTMVASNTHAPSIMIGEKASAMVLAEAG